MFDENNKENDLLGGMDFNFDLDSSSDIEENPFITEGNAEVKLDQSVSLEHVENKKAEENEYEPMDRKPETEESAAESDTEEKPKEESNLFEAAIAKAEEKQATDTKAGLIEKLPVFAYANATEEIADPTKTFDWLRNEKAEDFPELDDGTSVVWKMEYGKIVKNISTPKKTTIAEMKTKIEKSKEFLDSLKKIKGEVVCRVIPSVSAKKKGNTSGYKGVFSTVADAQKSGKAIAFVPSDDGHVYQVRCNKVGTFVARTNKVTMLPKVRAGFTPALPKIPYKILAEIIAFFRSLSNRKTALEAVVEIFWSLAEHKYYVYIPKQAVSAVSVDFSLPEMDREKFIHVLEIHSHNTMHAYFSDTDNRDEKATGLYMVIGRLNQVFPEIVMRMSVGGKFEDIELSSVFELPETEYPNSWLEAITEKKQGKRILGVQDNETCNR